MKLVFVVEDDISDCGLVITGGIQSTLNYVCARLTELQNGESVEFVFTRCDMSEEEFETAPVI